MSQLFRFWSQRKMFLEFSAELFTEGTELWSELLELLKSSAQLWSAIAFWILIATKNVIKLFCKTIPGGNRTLIRTVGIIENLVLETFGKLWSATDFCILIAAKNVIKLFCRTIPGGNRTLIRTVGSIENFWSWDICLGTFLKFINCG